jgi:putative serine protease PepD
LVGTGAAAAVFAGMALLNTASGPMATLRNQPTATTAAVLTTSPSPGAPAPASTRAVSEGLVALSATTAQGVRHGSGIAVATGGLIATTVDVVLGATKLVATEPSGHRERARLVAYDRRSGVALLRVPKAVPVPTFAGTRSLRPGTPAMVMAMDDGGASDAPAAARQRIGPGTRWTTALVQAAATPVRSGAAAGMTAIAASVPRWSPVAGEVLVSPDGVVIGMLDATSVPTGTSLTSTSTAASSPTTSTAASSPTATPPATFLPARLVTAVSEDLARWGRVRHGWLDVDAQDATTPSGNPAGALVVAVPRRGASSGLLGAGDVIEAVEGAPVTSMAQLRERLYVLPAGTQVELEITRHGTQTSAEVDLGSSP